MMRVKFSSAIFIAVAAFSACMIGGCALKQPPSDAELLTQALPNAVIPNHWQADPQTTAAAAVADNWIKLFNDPALDAIVAEAISYNLNLRAAVERVRIAQQNVVIVGAQLLPQVSVDAGTRSLRDESENTTSNTNIIYASVGWELDVWGRVRSQRAAAEAQYEASALDYAYARQSLAALVAKTWYLAIETYQLVQLGEEAVKVFENLKRLVEARREGGKDSNLDVVNTNAELENARSLLEAARQNYGEARRGLEVLLGRYPANDIEVAAAYPQLPPGISAGVPATLLERRPDIVAAQREILVAFRSAEAAELARLPVFGVSLTGGRLGDHILSLLNLDPWIAEASAGMSIPIYEGGALVAQVKIATAQQAQAVAGYGSAVLSAFQDAENALANDAMLARRIPLEERALANRTSAVEIATTQYLAGREDLLWVSQLQTRQITAQGNLIKLRSVQGANRIRLYLALGGSFDSSPAVTAPEIAPVATHN